MIKTVTFRQKVDGKRRKLKGKVISFDKYSFIVLVNGNWDGWTFRLFNVLKKDCF